MKKISLISNLFIITVMLLGAVGTPDGKVSAQKEVPTFVVEPTSMPTPEPEATEVPTAEPTPEPLPTDIPTDQPVEEPTAEPELSPTPESLITPTPELIPTEPVEPAPYYPAVADAAAPGHYLVIFKQDGISASAVEDTAASLQAEGGQITYVYKHAIQGFAAVLPLDVMEKLRQDPRVAYIQEDEWVSIADEGEDPVEIQDVQAAPPSWGLDRIDQRRLPLNNQYYYVSTAGAGVNVYVLDTGIRLDHQEFGGRAFSAYDFIDNDTDASDCQGHGTHVAGTIGGSTVGVAKDVDLYSVRVLGCDGTGLSSTIVAGIDWVAFNADKPAVANMSLVGPGNMTIDYAVINALGKGVTFVVAAGNYSKVACNYSPARVPAVITVGATDKFDQDAWYSNFGTCLDLYAPGSGIYSSTMDGTGTYGLKDGTSMAAPHVAGAAALYLAGNRKASPATVASVIRSNATGGVVSFPFGQGESPNRLLFISPKVSLAPVQTAPKNNLSTNNPFIEFAWKPVYNANSYLLQISTDNLFTAPFEVGVSGESYSLPDLNPDGRYYWRVRAVNAFGANGPWSAILSYVIDTVPPGVPVLDSPVDGFLSRGTPSFTWKPKAGAKFYQFAYNDSNSTASFLYQSGSLTTTYTKPPAMPLLTQYYWFVRARDAAGNWSDWSVPRTVTILPKTPGTPSLASPAAGGLTNDPTPRLSWYGASFGTSYQVQISSTYLFTSPVQNVDGIVDLYFDADTLPDGVYYWRVRAINAIDEHGQFSKPRQLTVDSIAPAPPKLDKPLDNANYRGTPMFSWLPSKSATKYQFAINTDDSTTDFDHTGPVQTNLFYKPPALSIMTSHYWFVRARDAAGNWSAWSASRRMFVLPPLPATPGLLQPSAGAITNNQTPDLTWNSSKYSVAYQIQVALDSGFNTIVQSGDDLVVRTFTPTTLPTGKYYWRVRGFNINDEPGPFSGVRTFSVDITPPTAPVLRLPANGRDVLGTPTFSWNTSASAVKYRFGYDDAPASLPMIFESGQLSTTSFKPPTMPANTPFYWFVQARDAAGNWSPWSAPFTVTVSPTVPATPTLKTPLSGYSATTLDMPEMSWNRVVYGYLYDLQIDNSSTFNSPEYTYVSDPEASSLVAGPLAAGRWYWRVRARNLDDQAGLWSVARYFTVYPEEVFGFDTDGDFEGWVQHPGAAWTVSGWALSNPGLSGLKTSSASYDGSAVSDFTAEARIRMDAGTAGSEYGFVIRGGTPLFNEYNDWMNAIYVGIVQGYDAGLNETTCVTIDRYVNGVKQSRLPGDSNCSPTILFDDWNILRVYMKGTTIKVYVNDGLLLSRVVSWPPSGRLGVYSYSFDAVTPGATDVDWVSISGPVEMLGAANLVIAEDQNALVDEIRRGAR